MRFPRRLVAVVPWFVLSSVPAARAAYAQAAQSAGGTQPPAKLAPTKAPAKASAKAPTKAPAKTSAKAPAKAPAPATASAAKSADTPFDNNLFRNSWFWGIHTGTTSIGTPVESGTAFTIGGQWMITRAKGALYVAYDQANFSRLSSMYDPTATNASRQVEIKNMRTGSIAGVMFPCDCGAIRPYAGLGVQISVLGRATPLAEPSGTAPDEDTINRAEEQRSRSAPFVMLGAQWQRTKVAFFGQFTAAPSTDDFLLSKGVTGFSFGLRYNFGRSSDL